MNNLLNESQSARQNVAMIATVALRLGRQFLNRVVFVGGAILVLLLTDDSVRDIRPTGDVDVIIEAVSYGSYAAIAEELRALGFAEDTSPGAPICRWRVDGIRLDVMPTHAEALGFGNRWYPGALAAATSFLLPLTQTALTKTFHPAVALPSGRADCH